MPSMVEGMTVYLLDGDDPPLRESLARETYDKDGDHSWNYSVARTIS